MHAVQLQPVPARQFRKMEKYSKRFCFESPLLQLILIFCTANSDFIPLPICILILMLMQPEEYFPNNPTAVWRMPAFCSLLLRVLYIFVFNHSVFTPNDHIEDFKNHFHTVQQVQLMGYNLPVCWVPTYIFQEKVRSCCTLNL